MANYPLWNRDEKFWRSVDRRGADECWPWTGGRNARGYGHMQERYGSSRMVRAHRVSYEIANGISLTAEVLVRHKCDNPICVNPSHLETGTHADNRADCIQRGRNKRGSSVANARLTEAAVREIKTSTKTRAELARQFGVDWKSVNEVQKGLRWAHVEVSK